MFVYNFNFRFGSLGSGKHFHSQFNIKFFEADIKTQFTQIFHSIYLMVISSAPSSGGRHLLLNIYHVVCCGRLDARHLNNERWLELNFPSRQRRLVITCWIKEHYVRFNPKFNRALTTFPCVVIIIVLQDIAKTIYRDFTKISM